MSRGRGFSASRGPMEASAGRGRAHGSATRAYGASAVAAGGLSGWSPLAGPQFAGLRGAVEPDARSLRVSVEPWSQMCFRVTKTSGRGASPGPPHDSARRKDDAARHLGRGLARGPRPKRTAGRGAARTPDPVGHGWGSEGAQPPARPPSGDTRVWPRGVILLSRISVPEPACGRLPSCFCARRPERRAPNRRPASFSASWGRQPRERRGRDRRPVNPRTRRRF